MNCKTVFCKLFADNNTCDFMQITFTLSLLFLTIQKMVNIVKQNKSLPLFCLMLKLCKVMYTLQTLSTSLSLSCTHTHSSSLTLTHTLSTHTHTHNLCEMEEGGERIMLLRQIILAALTTQVIINYILFTRCLLF